MNTRTQIHSFLLHDLLGIASSVGFAVLLLQTNILGTILTSTKELEFFGSFVAGLFFTSVFTTAPAMVALGGIANANSILPVVIFGALGATVGDFIIFRFIRDRFSEHLIELARHRSTVRRIHALLKMRIFRWMSFFVGGLVIASPLPDELGISLFGLSKMKTVWFIPLSFVFNSIGILMIGLVAQTF
ncbi:MAG: hypothetical protein WA058_04065 [Minisyncoccia bacterium]